jgi:hypothetical protein
MTHLMEFTGGTMLDWPATFRVVTLRAIAANTFSGVAALTRAGVPESWLTFPIGTLKTAGAVGLLLGLIGVPLIGTQHHHQPRVGEPTLLAEPEPGQPRVLVPGPGPQVSVECLPGLAAERQQALAAALAQHHQHIEVQIDVVQGEADHLFTAGAGVQQQHDQGGVAAGLEAAARARLEQPLQPVIRHDRDRLVGHDRRPYAHCRVGRHLTFLHQPGVQDLEDLEVGRGGGGRPAGEEVGDEGLQVGPGGGLGFATGVQEPVGLADGVQVGGHSGGSAVGGA